MSGVLRRWDQSESDWLPVGIPAGVLTEADLPDIEDMIDERAIVFAIALGG